MLQDEILPTLRLDLSLGLFLCQWDFASVFEGPPPAHVYTGCTGWQFSSTDFSPFFPLVHAGVLSRGSIRSCEVTVGWRSKTRQWVYEQDPCLRHLVIPCSSCHPNHLFNHLHRHHHQCMASSNKVNPRSKALYNGWWWWWLWWQWWRQWCWWCKKEKCASHLSATLYRMVEFTLLPLCFHTYHHLPAPLLGFFLFCLIQHQYPVSRINGW